MHRKQISGKMLEVRLVSAQVESIIQKLLKSNVTLYDVMYVDLLTVNFWVTVYDYRKLKSVMRSNSTQYTIVDKQGISWHLQMLRYHPILVLGVIFLIVLNIWLSESILFVRVQGNTDIPERYILECAKDCGIGFGVDRSMVRSEKVKNELLFRIPQLQWVGVNTYGCVAEISVKEGSVYEKVSDIKNAVSAIVACNDGVIESVNVLHGTALCTVGQSVKCDDVLISGYADCGLKVRAEVAKGEVFAFTNREFTAIALNPILQKGEMIGKGVSLSVRIGKKLIKLWNDSGISDATCDKMYLEDYWTLPGGFRLPVAIIKEIETYRSQVMRDSYKCPLWLEEFAEDYLRDQMIAGKVLNRETVCWMDEMCWSLTGKYACHEMIGKVKYEETLLENAEDN